MGESTIGIPGIVASSMSCISSCTVGTSIFKVRRPDPGMSLLALGGFWPSAI